MNFLSRRTTLIMVSGGALFSCVTVLAYILIVGGAEDDRFGRLLGACYGNPVAGAASYVGGRGLHPSMAIDTRFDDLNVRQSSVPEEARSTDIKDTELVVCLGEMREVLTERCEYDDGVVELYQYELEVWLVESATGREVVRDKVRGGEPDPCGEVEVIPSPAEGVVRRYGDPVFPQDVERWVSPYVKAE